MFDLAFVGPDYVDHDFVLSLEGASEQFFRQRIFHIILNRPTKWSSAEVEIRSFFDQSRTTMRVELNGLAEGERGGHEAKEREGGPSKSGKSKTTALDSFGRDLTELGSSRSPLG